MINKTIMITGGTGSFGQGMIDKLLSVQGIGKIIIYSRDEFKQSEMIKKFREFPNNFIRLFVGDVRDKVRLDKAMYGVDYVFHAAALKQIPSCEYNPFEAVKTNILGAENVIDCAINNGVKKVVALSTDKAVNPVNLYGATKLVAEKLFIDANTFGKRKTIFSIVRYGNVLASRGSVLQVFKEQIKEGIIKVTDEKMTRFWWRLEEAVDFAYQALLNMNGGEVFIPKLRSTKVIELAIFMLKKYGYEHLPNVEKIGIRPGEKIHECLISPDEMERVYDLGWAYYIKPDNQFFRFVTSGTKMKPFVYTSESEKVIPTPFLEEKFKDL